MSRDKQIEEMAKLICSTCQRELDPCGGQKPCRSAIAECNDLYNAGYRKSTDLAEEIFAEIDKRFETLLEMYPCNGDFENAKTFVNYHWKYIKRSIMHDYDAELKKKYTEGRK